MKWKFIIGSIVVAVLVVVMTLSVRLGSMPPPPMEPEFRPTWNFSPGMPTPLPTRTTYNPGELVDYTAQTGDTILSLAARFNSTEREIRKSNDFIPPDASTLPPGMPMKIPIYYSPLWGSPFQILPDSLFVNGPAQEKFDAIDFIEKQPGWFKDYVEYTGQRNRKGGELINYIAENYSISPRLLIAIVEYQTGAITLPPPSDKPEPFALSIQDREHQGLYRQLMYGANLLNNAYYSFREGKFKKIEHPDGRLEEPDPWQNAASVAIQYYFSLFSPKEEYQRAISPDGLARTYAELFGDPWKDPSAHTPGSLKQPDMRFPFLPGKPWTLTGGPHTGWGDGEPFAALDFAPPAVVGGCQDSQEWVTAIANGVIVRTDPAVAVLDLDGDGDERTGWTVLYLHLATRDKIQQGAKVKTGDPVGHPSCEGGVSTGTHVHIARKYNGEWIPAEGALAFNLEGWIAKNGAEPYLGTLTKFSRVVNACVCSDFRSQVQSEEK